MMHLALRVAYLLHRAWSWVVRPIDLGVRMILVDDGKMLLVRHSYMPGWHFPGGFMQRGETPLEAAVREAREEAGAELLEPPTLLGIYSSFGGGKNDHVATYVSRKFRLGRATDRWEIVERKFFALNALPPEFSEKSHKILRDLRLSKL